MAGRRLPGTTSPTRRRLISPGPPWCTGDGHGLVVNRPVNGTMYYFRVTAVNRVGEGPASGEAKAVPATVPGTPAGLTATPGKSKVTLRWAAPPSGGSPITGYIIH